MVIEESTFQCSVLKQCALLCLPAEMEVLREAQQQAKAEMGEKPRREAEAKIEAQVKGSTVLK